MIKLKLVLYELQAKMYNLVVLKYINNVQSLAAFESYTSEMCDLYMEWTNEIKNWTKIVAVVIVYEKDHA